MKKVALSMIGALIGYYVMLILLRELNKPYILSNKDREKVQISGPLLGYVGADSFPTFYREDEPVIPNTFWELYDVDPNDDEEKKLWLS